MIVPTIPLRLENRVVRKLTNVQCFGFPRTWSTDQVSRRATVDRRQPRAGWFPCGAVAHRRRARASALECRVGRAEPNATAFGDQGLADGRCRMPPQRVVRIGRFVGKHVAAIHGKVCHGTPGFWTKRVYIHARPVGIRPVVETADHRAADAHTSSSP
jgi:hypothetical protein